VVVAVVIVVDVLVDRRVRVRLREAVEVVDGE
jgi:hypothetical protein